MVKVNQNPKHHFECVDDFVEHSIFLFILNSPEALVADSLLAFVAVPAPVIVPPVVPAEQASNPIQYPCHLLSISLYINMIEEPE